MQIQLLSIELTNFKGIRSFSASFGHATNIFGDNATGKTSLFDAFTWLLFGKDSTDRKDFEVKTLDEHNNVIPEIDHEVAAVINVDGERIALKRIFKEKWVKKRGSADRELQGNESLFLWNDAPVQLKEWQARISGIVDESLFKLITNTLYFNQMPWQQRRNVLLSLAGAITNTQVLDRIAAFDSKADLTNLTKVLNSGKPLEDYRKQVALEKSMLNKNLSSIPTRIDEANRSIPEQPDYVALRAQKADLAVQLSAIDAALLDSSEALRQQLEAVNLKRHQAHAVQTKISERLQAIRVAASNERHMREMHLANLQREANGIRASISTVEHSIRQNIAPLATYEAQLVTLRKQWDEANARVLTFTDDQFCCPTCKRALSDEDADVQKATMEENFNLDKSDRLSDLAWRGNQLKKLIEDIQAADATQKQELATLRAKLQEHEANLSAYNEDHQRLIATEEQAIAKKIEADPELAGYNADLVRINAEIEAAKPEATDNTELITRKENIARDIEYLNKQLATADTVERANRRIDELKEEGRKLAQQIADLEKTEFQIEQFTKAKMDTLEERINGRFQMVKFKLFDSQINGGETECCEALINGVPFSDANNASRINAGLDIINTLCQHNNVYAPIFIDNAESVVSLLPTDSQVVRLVVSASDKKLRVAA